MPFHVTPELANQLSLIAVPLVFFVVVFWLPRLGVRFINPAEAKTWLAQHPDTLVLDVRSGAEFTSETGHIQGSVNLPLDRLSSHLKSLGPKLDPHKEETVLVVCHSDKRATRACRLLKKAGLANIVVLKGGIVRWRSAGLPTTRR